MRGARNQRSKTVFCTDYMDWSSWFSPFSIHFSIIPFVQQHSRKTILHGRESIMEKIKGDMRSALVFLKKKAPRRLVLLMKVSKMLKFSVLSGFCQRDWNNKYLITNISHNLLKDWRPCWDVVSLRFGITVFCQVFLAYRKQGYSSIWCILPYLESCITAFKEKTRYLTNYLTCSETNYGGTSGWNKCVPVKYKLLEGACRCISVTLWFLAKTCRW